MPSSGLNYFQSSTLLRVHQARGRFALLLALLSWQLAGIVPHSGVNKPRLLIRLNSVERCKRRPKPRYSVPPLSKIKLEANGAPRLLIYGRLSVATCCYRSRHLLRDYQAASSTLFHLQEISPWRHRPPCGQMISQAFLERIY